LKAATTVLAQNQGVKDVQTDEIPSVKYADERHKQTRKLSTENRSRVMQQLSHKQTGPEGEVNRVEIFRLTCLLTMQNLVLCIMTVKTANFRSP